MKRARQDRHEYLGGDLIAPTSAENFGPSITTALLSKKEKNARRKELNKKWKLHDRKVGSGVDPNPRHTLYFQTQLPCLAEPNEWARFQQSLCDSLPVTFRLGACSPSRCQTSLGSLGLKALQGRFLELRGAVAKAPSALLGEVAWIWPTQRVWQLHVDSLTLAKEPALESLSALLRREVALGHAVRQEQASMLPALLLDLRSHHCVLDVCAAPGSKTEQILYLMQRQQQQQQGAPSSSSFIPGMVVANDADPRRIDTLMRRYARCGSPSLLVTCARAEELSVAIGAGVFDRVVADVPCSGDGTIRKFPHIWRLFRPRMALELHSIQLQIVMAAVRMLKPGGRIVYSTCSINPIEDEAVVAALLRHFKGALHLVPATIPGLQSRPGLRTWSVSQEIFSIGEPDDEARRATVAKLPLLLPSMHPPSAADGDLHLEYCHRVLPHDQDMGGFFVAVMELDMDMDPALSSGSGGGWRAPKVSRVESMRTMQQLGYNPAAIRNPKDTARSGDPERIEYEAPDAGISLGFSPASHMCRGPGQAPTAEVYLVQSTQSRHLVGENDDEGDDRNNNGDEDVCNDGDGNGIFGSRRNGWRKPTAAAPREPKRPRCENLFLSLVSPQVRAALCSWAQLVPVQRAGVEVGALCGPTGAFRLHADSARDVFRCVDHNDPAAPTTVVPLFEFAALCRLGARPAVLTAMEAADGTERESLRLLEADWSLRWERLRAASYVFVSACRDPEVAEHASAAGVKRRLSKAERKVLKQGGVVKSSSQDTQCDDAAPAGAIDDDLGGLVLVTAYSSEHALFYFVTPEDTCASFAAALGVN